MLDDCDEQLRSTRSVKIVFIGHNVDPSLVRNFKIGL